MEADQSPILTITLYPRETECIACGAHLVTPHEAIPIYEGEALPNEWEGEWAGFDACPTCFAFQATITEPMPLRELARQAWLGVWLGSTTSAE